jgi:hypothetical protein
MSIIVHNISIVLKHFIEVPEIEYNDRSSAACIESAQIVKDVEQAVFNFELDRSPTTVKLGNGIQLLNCCSIYNVFERNGSLHLTYAQSVQF